MSADVDRRERYIRLGGIAFYRSGDRSRAITMAEIKARVRAMGAVDRSPRFRSAPGGRLHAILVPSARHFLLAAVVVFLGLIPLTGDLALAKNTSVRVVKEPLQI